MGRTLRDLCDAILMFARAQDVLYMSLLEQKAAFEKRHQAIMKEVILLHLAKMERSFNSRMDKESIPAGYRAVWDGLQRALDEMPNRSANVAFGLNENGVQLTDAQRTTFGHLSLIHI